MPEHRAPGEAGAPVAVGQELNPAVAPDDVLPSIVRARSEDNLRYIAYSAEADGDEVEIEIEGIGTLKHTVKIP